MSQDDLARKHDEALQNIVDATRRGHSALWDWGQQYYDYTQLPDFNYSELCTRAQEIYGVDLYPPTVASKLKNAYQSFCIHGRRYLEEMKTFSPYTANEVANAVDINVDNVGKWIEAMKTLSRKELRERLGSGGGSGESDWETIRISAGVGGMFRQAREHFAASVGLGDMSATSFIEFFSKVALDTSDEALRTLWDEQHGV